MHAPPLLCRTTADISSLSCDFCGLASLMSPSRRRCTLSRSTLHHARAKKRTGS
jgi:hypothetical protein